MYAVCIYLAKTMLYLAKKEKNPQITEDDCEKMAIEAVENGSALNKLKQMVAAQGGDVSVITDPSKWKKAQYAYEVVAQESGYVTHTDAMQLGIASMVLGAGREKKEDSIDFVAGIQLLKKTGDAVTVGDTLAVLYTEKYDTVVDAEKILREAYTIKKEKPAPEPLILAKVTKDGVQWFGK